MNRPPVSVTPWRDESIVSMLWRLQAVTGRSMSSLRLKSFRKLYDDPDPAVLEFLGSTLGVEAETLTAHTLEGRLGESYASLGWRDHRMPSRWGCPDCGYQTVWSRLVLVSACPGCNALLSEDGTSHGTAPGTARELQAAYLDALIDNRLAADLRIERFWRLLSFHLCTGWWTEGPTPTPMPVGTGLSKPRDLPWRNPEWIAQFATLAWPATETTKAFRKHIKQATVATLLTETHDERDGVAELERDLLHRQIRRWRLEERHVPDHLLDAAPSPLAGCHVEAIGYAISRALRREVVLADSGHRLTKEELIAGRGPLRQTREIAAINQLLAHDPAGPRILHRLASELAGTDPDHRIDYQERRATLATVRGVPASVLRRLSSAVRDRPVARRVRANHLARDAAAWLWIELAGGVLHHSPHHAAARTRLNAFDRNLTPEDRLTLLEYGYEVLGAVSDDVARQHRYVGLRGPDERRTDVG